MWLDFPLECMVLQQHLCQMLRWRLPPPRLLPLGIAAAGATAQQMLVLTPVCCETLRDYVISFTLSSQQ